MKAFISYSHRDVAMLERLHVHLAMLRREGGISDWYDRQIPAGGTIDREVSTALESSDVFLALVSPDFLNSQYCYEREMQMAIERHEAGALQVVPIIVEPCDWQTSPLRQFKAIPRDGRPISDWTNSNAAWLDVVTELRRLVGPSSIVEVASSSTSRSRGANSKYRVKKSFDQIDRSDYRKSAYEAIRDYFEKSIREIDDVEGLRGRYEAITTTSFTCTAINRLIKSGRGGEAHITVRTGDRSLFGDISYSFAAHAQDNTANGSFTIDADDYRLYLRGDQFASGNRDRVWDPHEAAMWLWQEFLAQAGISYD